jgi:hypothetical protein
MSKQKPPMDLSGVEFNRWEKSIPHDPRSEKLARAISEIDYQAFGDCF